MVALGSTLIDTAKFGSNDVTSFYLGSNEAWTAGEPAELIKPTTIANSGGSATLGTNGQVTFSGVTSLSLNGVFSADFDNYVISMRHIGGGGASNIEPVLRSAGSDATGSDYTIQTLQADSTTINATRYSARTFIQAAMVSNTTAADGTEIFIYGPYLAQPTAFRFVGVYAVNSAYIRETAATHSLSTSYDGITFNKAAGFTFSGAVQVYGLRT